MILARETNVHRKKAGGDDLHTLSPHHTSSLQGKKPDTERERTTSSGARARKRKKTRWSVKLENLSNKM